MIGTTRLAGSERGCVEGRFGLEYATVKPEAKKETAKEKQ